MMPNRPSSQTVEFSRLPEPRIWPDADAVLFDALELLFLLGTLGDGEVRRWFL